MNMELVMTIGLSTLVALIGVVIGARVQRVAKFIYPTDFMTLLICGFCILDYSFQLIPFDKYWYLPLLFGYGTGYLVVGRTSYIMIQTMSLANKIITTDPWVIWEDEGRMFTQEQKNIALLRRLFFNVRHEVVSNSPLNDDWTVMMKVPMLPLINRPMVYS